MREEIAIAPLGAPAPRQREFVEDFLRQARRLRFEVKRNAAPFASLHDEALDVVGVLVESAADVADAFDEGNSVAADLVAAADVDDVVDDGFCRRLAAGDVGELLRGRVRDLNHLALAHGAGAQPVKLLALAEALQVANLFIQRELVKVRRKVEGDGEVAFEHEVDDRAFCGHVEGHERVLAERVVDGAWLFDGPATLLEDLGHGEHLDVAADVAWRRFLDDTGGDEVADIGG